MVHFAHVIDIEYARCDRAFLRREHAARFFLRPGPVIAVIAGRDVRILRRGERATFCVREDCRHPRHDSGGYFLIERRSEGLIGGEVGPQQLGIVI